MQSILHVMGEMAAQQSLAVVLAAAAQLVREAAEKQRSFEEGTAADADCAVEKKAYKIERIGADVQAAAERLSELS